MEELANQSRDPWTRNTFARDRRAT